MKNCIEIAIFKVAKKNIARVKELSQLVVSEMNAEKQ